MQIITTDATIRVITGGRSDAQGRGFVVLKFLSFFVGVIIGGIFGECKFEFLYKSSLAQRLRPCCLGLFPLPLDLDRIVDVTFGFINYVSSVRMQEWVNVHSFRFHAALSQAHSLRFMLLAYSRSWCSRFVLSMSGRCNRVSISVYGTYLMLIDTSNHSVVLICNYRALYSTSW